MQAVFRVTADSMEFPGWGEREERVVVVDEKTTETLAHLFNRLWDLPYPPNYFVERKDEGGRNTYGALTPVARFLVPKTWFDWFFPGPRIFRFKLMRNGGSRMPPERLVGFGPSSH